MSSVLADWKKEEVNLKPNRILIHLFMYPRFWNWTSFCRCVYNKGEKENFKHFLLPDLLEIGGKVEEYERKPRSYMIEFEAQWLYLKWRAETRGDITVSCLPRDRPYFGLER